ncbi:adhesion G-protein coupled receptor D2 [Latimeria chalumnae]|uniref:adhesion G-protein coupled receptor D2 n=1 Tax=Latimeria chalumnae TaxID=7897 RepID=UPI00313F2984
MLLALMYETNLPDFSKSPFTQMCSLLRNLQSLATLAQQLPFQEDFNTSSVLETPDEVYEYVNTPLNWWQANKYCKQHFGRMLFDAYKTELVHKEKLLQAKSAQGPVWLYERDNDLEVQRSSTMQKRILTLPVLIFQNKTDTKYTRLLVNFPTMAAVTVCVRVQWNETTPEISTIFSYAVPSFINELQLRGCIDKDGYVQLALIVHGSHSPYVSVFKSDGQWHHLCVIWQKQNGDWAIYADGKKKKAGEGVHASKEISELGVFIVGQDQDSLGGSFKEREAFSGNITDLNVWSKVLSEDQIAGVRSCCSLKQELIFGWNGSSLEIEPTVEEAKVEFVCPAILYSLSKQWVLPNSLSLSLIAEPLFLDSTKDLNILEAAATLKITQQALSEENTTLESSDLLGVIQLLRNTADILVEDTENLEVLQNLSQHFVEVAGAILEEQNADKWFEINGIIKGPMTIVHSIDMMALNLNQLLNPERNKLVIQSKNIQLEVRQIELSRVARSGDVYVAKNASGSTMDQIQVPKEEIEMLLVKGVGKTTFINTWYGSLQSLVGNDNVNNWPRDSTVSDGGYKYLTTELGSAIISATVLGENEPINTAIYYRLQHRPWRAPGTEIEPLCVFWNFSLRPEIGGSWSTEGCSITSSDSEFTSCFCNHTTNFALLLQIYQVQRSSDEESTLRILTFIGCGVSLCCLIVTLILFLVVGVPKSDRTTVHKNLILALAAAEALLMFSELANSNKVVCIAVAAFLHLFFMAAFAWMLVEGLLLWSKVVVVNMNEDKRMKFYYLTGWGIPIIIVGITMTTSFNNYVADSHCWLNIQTDIIWAFVGPVLFVLIVNTFVLFRVIMVTVSSTRRRSKMLTPNSSPEKRVSNQIWAAAKPVLVLLPVLGLTWLCGVLVHLNIILAYIFIGVNSFQGLYIFLVYTVYNSEVRNAIKRMKEKKKALSFTWHAAFLNEFSELISCLVVESAKLIVLGDFNTRLDDGSDNLAVELVRFMQACGFVQAVSATTHEGGHILDLVFSRGIFITNCSVNPLVWDDFSHHDVSNPSIFWYAFPIASDAQSEQVLRGLKATTCAFDPYPSWLLKESLEDWVSLFSRIVNASLEKGILPSPLKKAQVIEKVVVGFLREHLDKLDFYDRFQSGFRLGRSTKYALVKVVSDLLTTMDKGLVTFLIQLDLSSAFDMISLLSWENCSQPITYLSSPRSTTSWNTERLDVSPPNSSDSTPMQRNSTMKFHSSKDDLGKENCKIFIK